MYRYINKHKEGTVIQEVHTQGTNPQPAPTRSKETLRSEIFEALAMSISQLKKLSPEAPSQDEYRQIRETESDSLIIEEQIRELNTRKDKAEAYRTGINQFRSWLNSYEEKSRGVDGELVIVSHKTDGNSEPCKKILVIYDDREWGDIRHLSKEVISDVAGVIDGAKIQLLASNAGLAQKLAKEQFRVGAVVETKSRIEILA